MSKEYLWLLDDDMDNNYINLFLAALKEQIPSVIIKKEKGNIIIMYNESIVLNIKEINVELMFIQLVTQINILHNKY